MLTDTAIKNLKPKTSSYRVYDKSTDQYRGLNIKITPKGTKSFSVEYRDFHKRQFYTIGQYPLFSLKEARNTCEEIRIMIAKGIDPKEEKHRRIDAEKQEKLARQEKEAQEEASATFQDLSELYLSTLSNRSTHKQCKGMFQLDAIPTLGSMRLSEITTGDIKEVLDKPLKRNSPSSQRSLYEFLHAAFELGKNATYNSSFELHLIWPTIENPVTRIKKPSSSTPRDRYLSEDEVLSLWNAAKDSKISEQMNRVLLLLLATGQRVQEVSGMEWREIDFKNNVWIIPPERIKTGKKRPQSHTVPLTTLTRRILSNIPKIDDICVFPHSYTPGQPMAFRSINQAVHRLAEAAKVNPFVTKDIRRTVKTHMARIRIPKAFRDMIQNHSLNDVASIYYDQWDGYPEKQEALRKWNIELIKIIKSR
jgi:integrase